jgi:hypothetical protein
MIWDAGINGALPGGAGDDVLDHAVAKRQPRARSRTRTRERSL